MKFYGRKAYRAHFSGDSRRIRHIGDIVMAVQALSLTTAKKISRGIHSGGQRGRLHHRRISSTMA